VSLVKDDDLAVSSRVFLAGSNGAVFIFSPTVADHVYMKLASGDDIISFLSNEAAEILPLQHMEETGTGICRKCGTPLRDGAVFCTICGEKVTGDTAPEIDNPSSCSNCGRKIRQGAKFCTGCGTPV
jgi:hypothetical protein